MSPDGRPWEVAGHDESRHRPGDEPLWNESYYMDFVAEDGSVGGYVRLGFYPNLGVAWWTTALVRPGEPSVLSLAFDLVPGEAPALEASGPRCTAALAIPDPLSTLVVTSTADAAVFEDPAGVYRGEPGRPADLGLDLTWRTDGEPYHYRLTTRYEIPCLVEGTIHLDGHDVALRGHGQRDHSWGVPRLVGLRVVLVRGATRRRDPGAHGRHPDPRFAGGLRLRPGTLGADGTADVALGGRRARA